MVRYVIRRLLLTVLVIVGAAIVIFVVMYFVPGDPVTVILGTDATPDAIATKRAELGLDQPFFVQLGDFLYNTFIRFDLGTSWMQGTSVMSGIGERLPRTFLLGILTAALIVIVGIPLGIVAATHRGKWQDRGLIVGSMIFISIPEFWLAFLLIILFSLQLNWLPSFGIESWTCYILPVVAGAMSGICNVARQTRASVLDVINADFVTTARAKGMNEQAVVYKHMLPNALIPVITVAGNYFARCVGGTIVLEKIFSFPGIGLYLTDAISQRDYPIVRGCVVVIAAFTAILMLLVDLAYAFVDPQIKAQYSNSASRKGNKKEHGAHNSHGHGRHHQGRNHIDGDSNYHKDKVHAEHIRDVEDVDIEDEIEDDIDMDTDVDEVVSDNDNDFNRRSDNNFDNFEKKNDANETIDLSTDTEEGK